MLMLICRQLFAYIFDAGFIRSCEHLQLTPSSQNNQLMMLQVRSWSLDVCSSLSRKSGSRWKQLTGNVRMTIWGFRRGCRPLTVLPFYMVVSSQAQWAQVMVLVCSRVGTKPDVLTVTTRLREAGQGHCAKLLFAKIAPAHTSLWNHKLLFNISAHVRVKET